MRKIDLIVIHCSATRVDRTLTAFDLETLHRRRGFNGTGYHYYIRKDGTTLLTRPIERIGAHAKGSMRRVSESAMKAVWTAGDARQIHGRRNNVPPSPAGASIGATFPRLPGVRTPGSQSGSERRWGDRTGRVDQGVSLL